jgi:undecaprenyl phosphate-alpha-L-ara4N flippase subunit ArnE
MSLVLLLTACLLTCLGQIAQKLAVEQWRPGFPGIARAMTNAWLWLALLCLGLGLLVWLLVLHPDRPLFVQ